MYGNNIESTFIKKIRVPIFDQQGDTTNGTRYYFPENPQIDKNLVVGIEAHIDNQDLKEEKLILLSLAKQVFVSFYNKNKEEIFYNVPLVSLFGSPGFSKFKNRIKPYTAKIKSKMSYVYVPANSTLNLSKGYYVDLTFYLKEKK